MTGPLPEKIYRYFYLFFIGSIFLKLGSDTLEYPPLRIFYFVGLGLGFLALLPQLSIRRLFKSPAVIFFLLFFCFELSRLAWASWQIGARGLEDSLMLPLHRYLASPVTWLFYFGFFVLAFLIFNGRIQSKQLLTVLMWCAFILAVAAIPPLLIKGQAGYQEKGRAIIFFPAFVYFHSIVGKYLISRYAHPNYLGDIIAMGFFPALGLFFYSLQSLKERPGRISLILPGLFTAVTGLAVILFFSRGTIVCFAVAFLVFLIVAMLKYPSRIQMIFAGLAFALVLGFFLWAGDIQKTVKELQTVETELGTTKKGYTTGNTIREGGRRALLIYQTFTIWGAGTGGYQNVSELFSQDPNKISGLSEFSASNHYLQTLAEEGTGAFLYLLFLGAFLLESGWKLFRAKSRFQVMSGLSLLMPVLLISMHSAVSPILDYFANSSLTYILMGASLGVLHGDFERT